MRFIDVLIDFLDGTVQFYKDERVKVSDEDARRFCGNGWAQDPSGEFPTGTPMRGPVSVKVQGARHKSLAPTVGGAS